MYNKAKTPPFEIDEHAKVGEEVRLRYRYLDLRRPAVQRQFIMRNRITKIVRDYLDEADFLDIETPILCKSTPEGARDYLVPKPRKPRRVLCPATKPTDLQAIVDGEWLRPLLPNRQVLP